MSWLEPQSLYALNFRRLDNSFMLPRVGKYLRSQHSNAEDRNVSSAAYVAESFYPLAA